jgi:hypothetical protein
MSSHLIPKTVLEILDTRRRAFLMCSGSQCLLRWEKVCTSKDSGSLRLKNLETQNHCLLMKFLHKLHDPAPLPWNESLVQAT